VSKAAKRARNAAVIETIVVPFVAGGALDVLGRILGLVRG